MAPRRDWRPLTCMLVLVGFLLALVLIAGGTLLLRELRAGRRDRNALALLGLFGPAAVRAEREPRELLAWFPLAQAARRLLPDAFERLDRACGTRFPFSAEHLEAAHARCTAEWLAWERNHDFEYKLRQSEVERDLDAAGEGGTAIGRARIAAVEREQLERYQQRYEEYVRMSKALAALSEASGIPRASPSGVTRGTDHPA